jgi:hypothetical protein
MQYLALYHHFPEPCYFIYYFSLNKCQTHIQKPAVVYNSIYAFCVGPEDGHKLTKTRNFKQKTRLLKIYEYLL